MKNLKSVATLAAALLLLTACDKAVLAHRDARFAVKGDPQSALYPVAVTQDNEDVRIQLKDAAPPPEAVVSIDPSGHADAYTFSIEGNTVVAPAKFEHLQLRHKGAGAIDIFNDSTAK